MYGHESMQKYIQERVLEILLLFFCSDGNEATQRITNGSKSLNIAIL